METIKHATLAVVGVPLACGAAHTGTEQGPDALRMAGLIERLRAQGLGVRDFGNLEIAETDGADLVPVDPAPERRRRALNAWMETTKERGLEVARTGHLPLYLGGDHAMSFGTLAAQAAHAAEQGRPLFVLWLDAHADFNTPQTSETGHLHGMPMAYMTGLDGFEGTIEAHTEAFIPVDHVLQLFVRSVDGAEQDLIDRNGLSVLPMAKALGQRLNDTLSGFLDRVAAAKGLLHVSFDVDSLDPLNAPAVGTPVDGGPSVDAMYRVMGRLWESGLVTSVDVAELNPLLDTQGRTAHLVVDLIATLFGQTNMADLPRSA